LESSKHLHNLFNVKITLCLDLKLSSVAHKKFSVHVLPVVANKHVIYRYD
jgi:hypothetical protein